MAAGPAFHLHRSAFRHAATPTVRCQGGQHPLISCPGIKDFVDGSYHSRQNVR